MELKELCGKHMFSGCEIKTEEFYNTIIFVLDGIAYKAVEDPDDGYRSYCQELEETQETPKYRFEGIEVLAHMRDTSLTRDDVLTLRDMENGKIILEVGTEEVDDYYPCCIFNYFPENMECNQK